jgi:serine/threonine protein kinase
MLDVDPKKRPTALELCKHPWFTNMDSLPNSKLSNIQDYNLVRVCQICFLKEQKKRLSMSFILA